MAEKLPNFEFVRKLRGSIHPWEMWFDGSVWKVTQGEDFEGTTNAFYTSVYSQAKKHNCRVRATKGDNFVIFQAYDFGRNDHPGNS